MWKVQRADEGDWVVLCISGRLEGEQLADLREIFAIHAGNRKIALDMRAVRLVDQDAIGFLSRCETGGVQLRNCPAYIREWIERARAIGS